MPTKTLPKIRPGIASRSSIRPTVAERDAPLLDHRLTRRGGQLVEPGVVRRQAHVADGVPQLVVGEELLVVRAAVDQPVHQRIAVEREVADDVARPRCRARSRFITEAGVSRPTPLPIRAFLVG